MKKSRSNYYKQTALLYTGNILLFGAQPTCKLISCYSYFKAAKADTVPLFIEWDSTCRCVPNTSFNRCKSLDNISAAVPSISPNNNYSPFSFYSNTNFTTIFIHSGIFWSIGLPTGYSLFLLNTEVPSSNALKLPSTGPTFTSFNNMACTDDALHPKN